MGAGFACRSVWIVCLTLVVGGGSALAQRGATLSLDAEAPRFRHLTIDDGLSQNAVYAVLQDRQGFVWIGTKDGLNRYDGSGFEVHRHDPFDPATLPGSHVTALLEDREGGLWVGTQDGGVGRFDPATGTTTRYRHSPRSRITALAQDGAGDLWIGTAEDGLYRLPRDRRDRPGSPFDPFEHDPADARSLSHNGIWALLADRAGRLWVGTEDGLDRLRDAGGFDHYRHRADDPAGLLDRTVSALYEDAEGALWVGSFQGLSRLDDRAGGRFTHFPSPAAQRRPGWGFIGSIAGAPDGALWLATLHGLLRFDRESARYQEVYHDPLSSTSLSGNGVNVLLWDRTGVLWAGTNGFGLNLYDAKADRFQTIRRAPDPASRLDGFSVRALFEDIDGMLWISAGVVYRYDRRTATLTSFEGPAGRPEAFGNAGVWSIAQDKAGVLWFGGYEGLHRYEPASGAVRRYAHRPFADRGPPAPGVSHGGLPEKIVYGVFVDRRGAVWAATAHHLSRLDDAEAGRFTVFTHTPQAASGGAVEAFFPSLYESPDGLFWMGTEDGLVRFDPRTGAVRRYRTDLNDPASLRNNQVRAIQPDPTDPDVLWLGTAGGGLARFDRARHTFEHVTEADGLPNNVVYAVLPDGQGRFWLSTNRGLARYDPRTGAVKTYDVNDGLQSNEFNSGAYHRSRDGRLYVGGIRGVNAFDPDAIEDNPHVPPVVLTGLRIDNQPVDVGDASGLLPRTLDRMDGLRLGYRQAMVTFVFTALDFSAPEKNRYAYRMDGYDDAWIEGGTSRTATYTRLPPGHYTFRVRGSNNDGVWNEAGASLAVIITPPPWRTGWAYLGYVLVVLGVATAFYRNRRRRLLLRHRLEIERLEAEKLRDLDRAKSRLFANVSHEFRTPLTLTLGPLDDLQEGHYGPLSSAMAEQVALARRNAERVLGLVDQILDVARLEAGHLPLRARRVDLVALVETALDPFRTASEQNGVALSFRRPEAGIPAYADPDQLDKVVANLLSNALKFTPAGGRIDVVVRADGDAARVTVRDTGPGIPADALPHVFDRFYRVDDPAARAQPGTGIGLALAKEIADLHGGTLTVESEEGQGSRFTLSLPLGSAHLDEEQIVDDNGQEAPGVGATGSSDGGASLGPHPTSDAVPDHETDEDDDRTTVLIVEDHAEVRAYVRRHLDVRYRVLEAADGLDGLEKARSWLPDLIVSDVMMPRLDGLGLCRALKSDPETDFIPVLLLTARAEQEDRLEGLGEHADDYLTKPFDPRELRARVDNLIAIRQRLRERFRREGIALALGPDAVTPALHPEPVEVASADAVFLEAVRAAVEARFGDDGFSVEALAADVGLSRSQLYRNLKSLTRETPSEVIRRMRLERAAQLLDARAGTVSEVAYAVGFKSVAHFSNGFTAHYGCRPSVYASRPEDAV